MDIIDTYYEILGDFDAERLRAILAPDLVFEGSIAGRRDGAEAFIAGAAQFAAAARSITMLQREPTAALYDAQLPGGSVRFAEFFRVADGRIQALILHYDAGAFRAATN
jgi:ketosteroid isomerase-like protein